jgi:hypothetical protein
MRGPLGVVAAAVLALTCGALTSCEPEPIGGGEEPPQEQEEQEAFEPPTKEPEAAEFSVVPADEAGEANNQAGDEPLWGCTLDWMLDWPMETIYEPELDITYGMNLSCEWPEIGGPTIDSDLQATLQDGAGRAIDEAPMVTGGWDTDDYLESSDTAGGVVFPTQLRMKSHLVMQLIPGCGIDGCGDPDPGFVWGAMPPECTGTGTWFAVCEYEWRDINIANSACEDTQHFTEGDSSVSYHVTCEGGTATVTADINNADDGKCTYAHVWFKGGRWEWDALCEPGSQQFTLGTGPAPLVHLIAPTRQPYPEE